MSDSPKYNHIKTRSFSAKIRLIFITGGFFIPLFPIFIFIISHNISAAICTAAGMFISFMLTVLLHQIDDQYITGIVCDLLELTDALTELKERDIFPDNEDTVVSKLQTKFIKLIRILNQKQKRAVLENEKIKSLISDLSHQLKTPISNLKMYSEFLRDENLSPKKQREYIHILCLSVERLHFLSESMIKLSRLESGLIHLNMQEQSINETVLIAVKNIYPKAKEKNTEIIYREEKNIILCHDRNWTAEAIFNLLDNAVKYSNSGAKIYLNVKSYGMFSAITVQDENQPIPENERPKIFSRFYRGTNSLNTEGIGIGLYLVREIAIKQGGYIKLDCMDSGNQFTVVLGQSIHDKNTI